MYIHLAPFSGPITVLFSGPEADAGMICYPLPVDGAELLRQWHHDYRTNRHVSGIFADWLEEHKEELLAGASGGTVRATPAAQLDELIAFLRHKFTRERPAPSPAK